VNFDRADFEIRCEWGLRGLRGLAPITEVVIVVDWLDAAFAARNSGLSLPPASL
jgi:hypothetical protein